MSDKIMCFKVDWACNFVLILLLFILVIMEKNILVKEYWGITR